MSEHIKDAFFQLAIAGTSREYGLNQEEFFRRMLLAGFTISSVGVISITTAPVVSGVNLTNLNASNLASGTVPLARLSGITNTEIAVGAAIAQSKLALSITDAEVNSGAAISWSKLSKTGSSLADLTTRSAADLSSGTIATARLGSGSATGTTFLRGDSTWALPSVPPAGSDTYVQFNDASAFGGDAGLAYNKTTHALTQSGDHVFSADVLIRRSTSDGSDNGSLELNGGGATGTSRGGALFVYGNENGVPGSLVAKIGNVASSKFSINRADGTEYFKLLGSDGSTTFKGTISPPGATTAGIVTFDSSPDTLTLADTASQTFTLASGFVFIYETANGEGALFAVMNSVTAIIWQKGALFAAVSTPSKISVECSAGVVTIRNRSGSSTGIKAQIMRIN